jgi:hypothetical protein
MRDRNVLLDTLERGVALPPLNTQGIFINHGYLWICSYALVKYDILPRMKKRIISDNVPDKEGLAVYG